MARYIVFDVETPNRYNNRMSAIGITVVEDGQITDAFFSLVDPEQKFDRFNVMLTGIDSELVKGAPTFPQLWEKIEPVFSSGILVAHNAPFDMCVLRKCLHYYGIEWKSSVPGICTVRMGRSLLPGISHKLDELCAYYGIGLDHHKADSDSMACAKILIRYMDSGADPDRYIKNYTL